jgi:hypothetical protein
MKPGVRRDVQFVAALAIFIALWLLLGLVLLMFRGLGGRPADPRQGGLQARAAHHAVDAWGKAGLVIGLIGSSILVARFYNKGRAPGERPEDSYLSGRAVAVMAGLFAALMALWVGYAIFSDR